MTGYSRDYAAHLLGLGVAQVLRKGPDGSVYRLVADPKAKRRRKRPRQYGPEVLGALKRIWVIMAYACGKRLAPGMAWLVPKLETCGELLVFTQVREKLLVVSAATLDRLLAPERKRRTVKGVSHTKPGTWLKHPIPIRTCAQWDDPRPGFTEIDLVDHGGGSTEGDDLFTRNVTDVATGGTEVRAVKNRAQKWTVAALLLSRERLPFPLLGIDSEMTARSSTTTCFASVKSIR